jgi:hypothetical protein
VPRQRLRRRLAAHLDDEAVVGQRPKHMANIQEKVLHAMTPGEPMKKGAIMKAARLGDGEETRVRNVLARLKSAGVLTMKGVRGSATYTLKR